MKTSVHTPKDIGLIIRERRRQLGLNQAALAQHVGVSRQWIVAVEKGKARAEIGLLLQTLRALDLSLHIESPDSMTASPSYPITVDIDAVVERARGKSL